MSTDYAKILKVLVTNGVDFVVIGGVAANLHGSARVTFDLDLVYSRQPSNLTNLARALHPYHPYLRGAPPGLPFTFDEATLKNGLNFTLDTALGDVDLLGEVVGGGNFEQLLPHTIEVQAFGVTCKCVSLERLNATETSRRAPQRSGVDRRVASVIG